MEYDFLIIICSTCWEQCVEFIMFYKLKSNPCISHARCTKQSVSSFLFVKYLRSACEKKITKGKVILHWSEEVFMMKNLRFTEAEQGKNSYSSFGMQNSFETLQNITIIVIIIIKPLSHA